MVIVENVLITLGVFYVMLNTMYVLTILFLDLGDRLQSEEVFIMRYNNLLSYLLFAPGKVFITLWAFTLLILGSLSTLVILTIYSVIFKGGKK